MKIPTDSIQPYELVCKVEEGKFRSLAQTPVLDGLQPVDASLLRHTWIKWRAENQTNMPRRKLSLWIRVCWRRNSSKSCRHLCWPITYEVKACCDHKMWYLLAKDSTRKIQKQNKTKKIRIHFMCGDLCRLFLPVELQNIFFRSLTWLCCAGLIYLVRQ